MIAGIDPDCRLSGVAVYDPETKYFHVQTMGFFQLYDYLKENRERIVLVRIEAEWIIKNPISITAPDSPGMRASG
jgi:hypothetical protein